MSIDSPSPLPLSEIEQMIEEDEMEVSTVGLLRQDDKLYPMPAEMDLFKPTFFPVTETEITSRAILQEKDISDPFLLDLIKRIKDSVELLDQFRETGFILSSPESVLESLENMCSFF